MKEPNIAFFEDLLDESYTDEYLCTSTSEIKDLDLQRLCNCNSGYPWAVCPENTPYCG
jgi:hypothetical protein